MAFAGLTVQNQLGFHELTNVITNANGNVFLDLEKSMRHIVYAIDDLAIYIEGLDPQNPIPQNKFIDIDLLIIPQNDNIILSFDPTFIWSADSRLNLQYITLHKGINLSFNLYSIDSGAYWRISFSGTYGPSNGYLVGSSRIDIPDIYFYNYAYKNTAQLYFLNRSFPNTCDEILSLPVYNSSNEYKTLYTLTLNNDNTLKYFNRITSKSEFTRNYENDYIQSSFYYNGKHYISALQDPRTDNSNDCSGSATILNSDGSIYKSLYITDYPIGGWYQHFSSCISNNSRWIIGFNKWEITSNNVNPNMTIPGFLIFDLDGNYVTNKWFNYHGLKFDVADSNMQYLTDFNNTDNIFCMSQYRIYSVNTNTWQINYGYLTDLELVSAYGSTIAIDDKNNVYFSSHKSSNQYLDSIYKLNSNDTTTYEFIKTFDNGLNSTQLVISGLRYIDDYLYFVVKDMINSKTYLCKINKSGDLLRVLECSRLFYSGRVLNNCFYLLNHDYITNSLQICIVPISEFEIWDEFNIDDHNNMHHHFKINTNCYMKDGELSSLTPLPSNELTFTTATISINSNKSNYDTYLNYNYKYSESVVSNISKFNAYYYKG